MKLGPLDFNQPSTWRGLIGFIAVSGISLSPELANQIALVAAGLLSLIEMIRNEYHRRHTDSLPPIEVQSRAAAAVVQSDRLRQSLSAEAETARLPESSGFGDR
ncbi:MAG: hypothetical protein IPL99_12215 [Candidatus Competibacteraceae bacterium]|nr:hypothetical protein [Candidatus Competibacteraceae bacterium]